MSHNPAQTLRLRGVEISQKIVALIYQRHYGMDAPETQPGYEKSLQDTRYHLAYLAEAIEADEPRLFGEYLAWVKVLFSGLKFPDDVLMQVLTCMQDVLTEELPQEELAAASRIMEQGIQELTRAPLAVPTFVNGDAPLDDLARRYLDALLHADRRTASEMILTAVRAGTGVREIYLQVFQRVQHELGRLWQTNQISVAQEHFSTAATQMVMSQLYPYIFNGERKDRRIVVACVGAELHEIGARMVADFFEMDGWDSYFLGANSPPETILKTVFDQRADLLALSTTMTFHVNKVAEIIRTLRQGPSAATRVLVGGYPFNISPDLWQKVGADGYAADAAAAVEAADRVFAK